MPAARDFALKQINRFASFPGAPKTHEELFERAQYLANLSNDNDHCRLLCDRMMSVVRYFPLPADMHAASEISDLPEWTRKDQPSCKTCNDTGRVFFERNGYSFAGDCPTCHPKREVIPDQARGASGGQP